MKRKGKAKKNGLVIALMVVAFLMAIGYAAFSSDLLINPTGKILFDFDVQFTDWEIDEVASTLKDNGDGGAIVEEADVVLDGDGLTITVNAALTYFDDRVVFNIDITNFSELFDAELVEIDIDYDELDPFIRWAVTGIVNEGPMGTAGNTMIARDATSGVTPNRVIAILTATWDPIKAAANEVPVGATSNLATTYTETTTITLTFNAV